MSANPLVSVITPFYNTDPRFMTEAIESVLKQTYTNWEILLIDDGSAHESTECARKFAALYPDKIRYLEHPHHRNLGASAARQLGISRAKGAYITLLDADDLWLPLKLEQQVALMNAYPDVGVLYGNTKYWYSWTGNPGDIERDYLPELRIAPNTVIAGAKLLERLIGSKIAVPCTCSIMVRHEVVRQAGGFEADLPTIYDDQMFYAKIFLIAPVLVSHACWDWYRQHPSSGCSVAREAGQIQGLHLEYLKWLSRYLSDREVEDGALWQALRRQLWYYNQPSWPPLTSAKHMVRRIKKWCLRLEERMLPAVVRRWLWT